MFNRPVSLLDERQSFSAAALMPLLSDSAPVSVLPTGQPHGCDFTVYAAIGGQHSGKSTVLNAFARSHGRINGSRLPVPPPVPPTPGGASFAGRDSTRPEGFETASVATMTRCLAQTRGVDVLVTPERNILIDTPPLDSAAVLAAMLASNDPSQPQTTALEHAFQLRSLHTLLLLLECCHVLLVVCEPHTLLHTCTLLQRALLLRQHLAIDAHFLSDRASANPTGASGPASARYYAALPDIVFVVNKVPLAQMERALLPGAASYQKVLSNFFHAFPFRKHGAVNTYGRVRPGSTVGAAAQAALANNAANCFVLPFDADAARGAPAGETQLSLALQELAVQLLSMPKLCVRARTSEREWLRLVARIWAQLQQEPALQEFKQAIDKSTPAATTLFVPPDLRNKAAQGAKQHQGGSRAVASAAPAAAAGAKSKKPRQQQPKQPKQNVQSQSQSKKPPRQHQPQQPPQQQGQMQHQQQQQQQQLQQQQQQLQQQQQQQLQLQQQQQQQLQQQRFPAAVPAGVAAGDGTGPPYIGWAWG